MTAELATIDTIRRFDVAILGSGFSGSILAWILEQSGLRTILIDKDRHPRFAIGESSTPSANLILRSLAETYDLPELETLSRYGTWRDEWPKVRCGLKRGFSYFAHRSGEPFSTNESNVNQLLVAASVSDDQGDTQWFRTDVDHFLASKADTAGATLIEATRLVSARHESTRNWSLDLCQANLTRTIAADFVVDATGAGQALVRTGAVECLPGRLQTRTRSIFAHVRSLPQWEDCLNAIGVGSTAPHPFRCDDSAMHHLLDEGWMWWLRFDGGITSVGLVLPEGKHPTESVTPEAEFRAVLARYPSLLTAFDKAQVATPEMTRTSRLQRLNENVAGEDWALLPSTAGFVDPLHSTGIAHSLSGVERLASVLTQPSGTCRNQALSNYEEQVVSELRWIDQLTNGCYWSLRDFRKFVAFSMCYFAAASTYERHRLAGKAASFLCADDRTLVETVSELAGAIANHSSAEFESACQVALSPFNHVGLFAPQHPNMYECTALPM